MLIAAVLVPIALVILASFLISLVHALLERRRGTGKDNDDL